MSQHKSNFCLTVRGAFQQRQTLRSFMEMLPNGGADTFGPASISRAAMQASVNQLGRLLAKSPCIKTS